MLRSKEFLIIFNLIFCGSQVRSEDVSYHDLFLKLNDEILSVNHQTAKLAWETSFEPFDHAKSLNVQELMDEKLRWNLLKCNELKKSAQKFSRSQRRVFNILCHGAKYTQLQQRNYVDLANRIEKIYTETKICVPKNLNICRNPEKLWNSTLIDFQSELHELSLHPNGNFVEIKPANADYLDLKCFTGEPELENFMANGKRIAQYVTDHQLHRTAFTKLNFSSLFPLDFSSISHDNSVCTAPKHKNLIDFWVWESWRIAVGPKIKHLYPDLVNVMNEGARNDDFGNAGDIWKQEMEIGEDVDDLMKRLMGEIQPLYNMIHTFLRSILRKHHQLGSSDLLPAHILGWNANWYHLFKDHVEPEFFKNSKWNMDEALKTSQWEPVELMKRVEDFYTSTGLSSMTKSFWNKSLIDDARNVSCHGTAADMFYPDDFRMVVCGCKSFYDFYVIIHEMGHVEQYMLAQKQPPSFRAGNSVIQETIGDAFFLAMMTPMHLNRLRLINDDKLFPSAMNDFDMQQLMMMAFMKLPEIPFGYVFEKFRFDLFAERVGVDEWNDYFWDLTRKYQKIEPPNLNLNRHQLFDAAAKFHLASNVPYARYFFANILQYQVFRALCEKTFYGKLNTNQALPLSLHKCDIYGSKRAGNLLKKALQPGGSMNFKTILKTLTGSDVISADALLEYYEPLTQWLEVYFKENGIQY